MNNDSFNVINGSLKYICRSLNERQFGINLISVMKFSQFIHVNFGTIFDNNH